MTTKFRRLTAMAMLCLMLTGCGNTKTIHGVRYDVFGLANESEKRNPDIEYEVSVGNIIVALIFSETIIIPLYVLLWDLYQPVGPKPAIKGQAL